MSPTPSPSPPPSFSRKVSPTTFRRHETARNQPVPEVTAHGTASAASPAPVQATSASIFYQSHHEDDQGAEELQPARSIPKDKSKLDDHRHHTQEDESNDDDGNGDDDSYPQPEQGESLLPPPAFNPLFTLITSPNTSETQHPHVYYVFSDDLETERDGHDVATVAALRALDQAAQDIQRLPGQPPKDVVADDEIEERFVLLDFDQTTTEDVKEGAAAANFPLKVKKITSLSPRWAVTKAELRGAPTFEDEDAGDGSAGLMLVVEGIELEDDSALSEPSQRRRISTKGKTEQNRHAVELLEEARKRSAAAAAVPGGAEAGTILQGMDELWRGMSDGMGILDKVLGDGKESSM